MDKLVEKMAEQRRAKARRVGVGVLALAAIGGGAAGLVGIVADDGSAGAEDTSAGAAFELATVEQRDLLRIAEIDGVVGRGTPTPVPLAAHGTLTGLPKVGDVIASGQQIAEVDGVPIIVLTGARPAWRDLRPGISAGEDIRQLEAALVALGHADPEKVTVDDTWTSATTAAVKAMQEALGIPEDGRLTLGEIVFAPATMRVAAVSGVLGDAPAAAGIQVTGEAQVVSAEVDPEDADLLAVGDVVEIELPTGDDVEGTVVEIGEPEAGADGSVGIPVRLTADGLDTLDGLSVEIRVAEVAAQGATAVPADALLALAEGGYAVEAPDETSPRGTRLVKVDVGMFADGWVQVTGDIAPGDQVVVP